MERLVPVKIPDTSDLLKLAEKDNGLAAKVLMSSRGSGLDPRIVQRARSGAQRLGNKRERLDEIDRTHQD